MTDQPYDVAVIGAGPAGAATARRLAQHGCRVLLLEASAFDEPRVGETLAPSVQPLLGELGVWDRFAALAPLPSWGTRAVWGGPQAQEHSHIASPYGCGWHIDRQWLDRMLAEAASDAGACLRTRTRLIDCAWRGDRWCLSLVNAARRSEAAARVVVDATGRGARLARRLEARRLVFDRLVGVTVQYAPVPGEGQCYTLVETVADGWWYSAPVGGDRLTTMLMTDGDICGRGDLASFGEWQARLRNTGSTADRVADASVAWGPRTFNALSQRLRRGDSVLPWLAVGDAALAVDPISGSGVVRALRTAKAGADAVVGLLGGALVETLRAYEAERDHECTTYLQERRLYYGVERRWADSPFWQRRAAVARSDETTLQ